MNMKQRWGYYLSVSILLLSVFQIVSVSFAGSLNPYGVASRNPYVVRRFLDKSGQLIDEVIVPGRPPESYRAPEAVILENSLATGTNTLSNVPAYYWSYGCSATSAAMLFGYYDNTGYPNVYTGPTNGGVAPMTNAVWGPSVKDSGEEGECPLSATRLGLDGRTINGHVDDYYIAYGSTDPDPFIGNWPEHVQGECTGDFMGTNQSLKSNTDGSTTFYYWKNGSPFSDYTGSEPEYRDGCHGMNLFFQSRGYSVQSNYSQLIPDYDGNTQGFTFQNYMSEIDAGRPVLIELEGHTIIGYGYNVSGSLAYVHDTWDYLSHSMTWGGTYGGMQQWGVTVFIPSPAASPTPIPIPTPTTTPTPVPSGNSSTLLWASANGAASVWTMNSSGNMVSWAITNGAYPGWTARSYHLNSGGTADMLWVKNSNGTASVQTLNSSGMVSNWYAYGPESDAIGTWTAVSYHPNSDGTGNLLWVRTDGTPSVWLLDSGGNMINWHEYPQFSGWTVTDYRQNCDGTANLIYVKTDGTASVWTVNSSNFGLISYALFPSIPDSAGTWFARSYYRNSDGTANLLWVRTDGFASDWTLNSSNAMTGWHAYPACPGWTPLDYDKTGN